MAGWSKEKRVNTEKAFYAFLDNAYVFSKERGRFCVGQELYDGQRRVISEIFDALEDDIHDIYILKSRQLGVSTIFRVLIVFLIGIHKGVKGAIASLREVPLDALSATPTNMASCRRWRSPCVGFV